MFLREQSWRNSFALKWGGKSAYFLSQSSRRWGEMIVFLSALRNIWDVLGSTQVFQFMYVEKNLFYYKEILHCAVLRSEWQSSVLESRIKNSRHRDEIRDTSYEVRVFLSQSPPSIGEMIVFLRALRNIGDVLGRAQVFQFMYVKKTYSIIKRFFTMLRFVQNDRVLFRSHGLKIRAIR